MNSEKWIIVNAVVTAGSVTIPSIIVLMRQFDLVRLRNRVVPRFVVPLVTICVTRGTFFMV